MTNIEFLSRVLNKNIFEKIDESTLKMYWWDSSAWKEKFPMIYVTIPIIAIILILILYLVARKPKVKEEEKKFEEKR